MDQSPGACRYDGPQRTAQRRLLREILEDLDRQDRALLRVSSDLLDTIAALKEANEASRSSCGPWTNSTVAGGAETAEVGATIEGGSTGLWTCTPEKRS